MANDTENRLKQNNAIITRMIFNFSSLLKAYYSCRRGKRKPSITKRNINGIGSLTKTEFFILKSLTHFF